MGGAGLRLRQAQAVGKLEPARNRGEMSGKFKHDAAKATG